MRVWKRVKKRGLVGVGVVVPPARGVWSEGVAVADSGGGGLVLRFGRCCSLAVQTFFNGQFPSVPQSEEGYLTALYNI